MPTSVASPFVSRTLLVLGTLLALFLPACTSLEVAAPPVDKLTLPKNANRTKLAEGRQVLATHCVKCHGAPRIAHHSVDDWNNEILPEMTRKAKLTPQQAALLKNYVLTAHQALAEHPPARS